MIFTSRVFIDLTTVLYVVIIYDVLSFWPSDYHFFGTRYVIINKFFSFFDSQLASGQIRVRGYDLLLRVVFLVNPKKYYREKVTVGKLLQSWS